jgi:hypothetical protein
LERVKRLLASFAAVAVLLSSTVAWAHGQYRIRDHRFAIVDGHAKAHGEYVTSQRHRHLSVTVFIVEAGSGRIAEEKTRRCDSGGCKHVHVQVRVPCTRTLAYYAVIQGDVRTGGHFAIWNSKTLVCE